MFQQVRVGQKKMVDEFRHLEGSVQRDNGEMHANVFQKIKADWRSGNGEVRGAPVKLRDTFYRIVVVVVRSAWFKGQSAG